MHITVYAASSGQLLECYLREAEALGRCLAERKHTLINGAGRTGLMAATANAVLAAGGKAIGVIPAFMIAHNWQHQGMTRLEITPDMHLRKEKMATMADACIALPGGPVTMEELLEIITWKQLGLFAGPIVILNTNGYYDALLAQLHQAADEQFMRPMHLDLYAVATTAEEALHLAATLPPWDKSKGKFAAL